MIIDLIGNALEIPSDEEKAQKNRKYSPKWVCAGEWSSEELEFDWDAHAEWQKYATDNFGTKGYSSNEKRIEVITAVIKDDHMRDVLRKASKRSIRSQVGLIIDKYLSGEWSLFEASAQIVELDRK